MAKQKWSPTVSHKERNNKTVVSTSYNRLFVILDPKNYSILIEGSCGSYN